MDVVVGKKFHDREGLLMRRFLLGLVAGLLLGTIGAAQAGPLVGEESGYIREQGFEERFFYVSGGNGDGQVEYQAWAVPNTATSAASWRIRKFTYDSSNRVSTIEWAGGNDAFNQILDNRASLSY